MSSTHQQQWGFIFPISSSRRSGDAPPSNLIGCTAVVPVYLDHIQKKILRRTKFTYGGNFPYMYTRYTRRTELDVGWAVLLFSCLDLAEMVLLISPG